MGRRAMEMKVQQRRKRARPKIIWLDKGKEYALYQGEGLVG